MARSPAILWCPNCNELHPCRSLNLSYFCATGHQLQKKDHEDINYFRRFRCCEQCGHDFETAEVPLSLLDEFIELRSMLTELKLNAAAYELETANVAKKLKKLRESLSAFKALE